MKLVYLFTGVAVFLLTACVSKQKFAETNTRITRLQADSSLLEKRIRLLTDEKNDLAVKSATMEQSLNQRLQEKQDSIAYKEKLLQEREYSLKDMKARKEEERDAFTTIAGEISKAFGSLQNSTVSSSTDCSHIIIDIPEKTLFSNQKPEPFLQQVTNKISETLKKYPDLNLRIVTYSDSTYTGKEKTADGWEYGAFRSVSVTRLLTKESQTFSARITPASAFDPALARNGTKIRFMFYSALLPCIHSK